MLRTSSQHCKRVPKRPSALLGDPPRKTRCAVDDITQSKSKSACAVGNVIRQTPCALDVRSGQDKFKAAIGDERATSCKPKKHDSSRYGHVIPDTMLCHTMSCDATPCHVVPSHAMPCYAMPCSIMLCHGMVGHDAPFEIPTAIATQAV